MDRSSKVRLIRSQILISPLLTLGNTRLLSLGSSFVNEWQQGHSYGLGKTTGEGAFKAPLAVLSTHDKHNKC